jgi:hypothetical protein
MCCTTAGDIRTNFVVLLFPARLFTAGIRTRVVIVADATAGHASMCMAWRDLLLVIIMF